MRRRVFLAALGATALAPASNARACRGTIDGRPLRIGRLDDFENFDPLFAKGDDEAIARSLHMGAFDYDWTGTTWAIKPSLIDRVDLEDVTKGMAQTITLRLKPEVKLSDGSKVTAEMVVKSLMRQISFQRSPLWKYVVDANAVQLVDDQALTIRLNTTLSTFRELLLGPTTGCLIDPAVVPQAPGSWDEANIPLQAYADGDVRTSGAYKLASLKRSDSATLVCKGDYPSTPDSFKEIVFQFFEEFEYAADALVSNAIHILGPLAKPRFSTTLRQLEQNSSIQIERQRVTGSYMVAVNRPTNGEEPDVNRKLSLFELIRSMGVSDELSWFVEPSKSMFPSMLTRTSGPSLAAASLDGARASVANWPADARTLKLAVSGQPLNETIGKALAKHFGDLGLTLEITTEGYNIAYQARTNAIADLTLMRLDAKDLTLHGHLSALLGRDKGYPYDQIAKYLSGGMPAEDETAIQTDVMKSLDYIPLFDCQVAWATRKGLVLDLHFDGALGNLARLRYQ